MSKAAGKPKNAVWRKATRKGERVLIDPAGNVYHGTAQEIREAALVPYRRKMLADSIKFARYIAAQFDYTPEERREYVREKRRDAISAGHFDAHTGTNIPIANDVYILLCAGARLVRDNFDEYLAELFRSELDALLDVAEDVTGKREIPLTRYEKAALDRLRNTPKAAKVL